MSESNPPSATSGGASADAPAGVPVRDAAAGNAARPAAAAAPAARDGGRVAWLAAVLAAVAVLLAWLALQRAGDFERRFEDERVQAQAREQRIAEHDRLLHELQRSWSQAQAADELGAGRLGAPELRRRREALAMLDIERLVEQVQVQLRLGAPPAVAIDALAAADARLERLSGSAAARVQEALRHDLARLRAAPDLDRGLLASRLDPLLHAVDAWHASADPSHASARPASGSEPVQAGAGARPAGAAVVVADSFGARLRAWLAREFGDLLRIREIDTPDALRLGPAQQQLLRDRFRLGILDLREAILARDERTVRAEAAALEALLTRYFDAGQPDVVAAAALLRATAAAAVGTALPSLDETLGALRAARAAAAS